MSPSMDTNPNLIVPAGGGHIFVFGVHIYLSLAKSMVMHGPESRAKLWIYTYIDIYLFIYMYILTIWDSILDTHTRHRFTSVRISQRIGITNWSPVWPTVKEKLPGEHIFEWSFHTPFNQKSHMYKKNIYISKMVSSNPGDPFAAALRSRFRWMCIWMKAFPLTSQTWSCLGGSAFPSATHGKMCLV